MFPITGIKIREILGGEATANAISNALISAGIGDVSEYERLKTELRSKVDYIHELWDVKEEYKHRAEVAEKAGRIIQRDMGRVFDVSNPRICELITNIWDLAKKQAEKELQEERKDE